jgi:putative sigma-54 modulation protein
MARALRDRTVRAGVAVSQLSIPPRKEREPMRMTFSVRHGDVPDRLRQHAESEVEGLSKYFERLVEADIILDQEGHRHIAEVRVHTSTDTHFATSAADEWRAAIDATVDKLRRQLKRHKGKLEQRGPTREERERAFRASADGPGPADVYGIGES